MNHNETSVQTNFPKVSSISAMDLTAKLPFCAWTCPNCGVQWVLPIVHCWDSQLSIFCPWRLMEGLSWFKLLYIIISLSLPLSLSVYIYMRVCVCFVAVYVCFPCVLCTQLHIWYCIYVHIYDKHLNQLAQGFTTSHFLIDPCYVASLTASHR